MYISDNSGSALYTVGVLSPQYKLVHSLYIPKEHPQEILNLGGVNEIGAVVAAGELLVVGKAIVHIVTSTGAALLVLGLEGEVHEDGAAEKEENLICEDDAVTCVVAGPLRADVDVGRDDAVEIAPTNDHADGDGALKGAFDVVYFGRETLVRVRVGRGL